MQLQGKYVNRYKLYYDFVNLEKKDNSGFFRCY